MGRWGGWWWLSAQQQNKCRNKTFICKTMVMFQMRIVDLFTSGTFEHQPGWQRGMHIVHVHCALYLLYQGSIPGHIQLCAPAWELRHQLVPPGWRDREGWDPTQAIVEGHQGIGQSMIHEVEWWWFWLWWQWWSHSHTGQLMLHAMVTMVLGQH